MTSSVRPRPNYYDVLGLSPGATQDEIRKAFARGMGMFGAHPVGAAAQISAAFEILRNPLKRRAYDEAMGLAQPIESKPRQWSMAIPTQTTRGFVAPASGPAEKMTAPLAAERLERLARLAEAKPLAEPLPELRRTAKAEIRAEAEQLAPAARTKLPETPARSPVDSNLPSFDARPVEWKQPLLAFGALFVAAGLIGALAGSSVLDSEQAPPSAPRHLVGHAPVKAPAIVTSPATAAVEQPIEAASAPAKAEARREERRPLRLARSSAKVSPPADPAETDPVEPSAPPAAQSGGDGPSPAVETIAAAGLPLAAGVMARTIERIGYACGSIASANPADGAGVYKVTCTSGDVYRASPVHGRYRFKRWSRL